MKNIPSDQYEALIERLKTIEKMLRLKQKQPKEIIVDNHEFIQIMKISKRNAQTWRDQGLIGYSKVGIKIYYKMSDMLDMLDKYYIKAKQ